MDISIIVSTYNRSHNLPDCVQHLAAQENTEHFQWEALIVDNNSTDATKAVTEQLIEQYPINIHYLFEQNQGLSFARNCGIHASEAKYVIFIDDDIRVTPKWLASIYNRFVSENCDAVGGRIYVESPEDFPKWLTPELHGFLGHMDFGEKAFHMNGRDEFPYGGNMAVRRDIAVQLGGFNTGMGRKGEGSKPDELFKGEETVFFHQMTDNGNALWYEPDAIVLHKILPYQLEKKFFLTVHYNAGFQKALFDNVTYNRTFMGAPLFLYLQFIKNVAKYLGQLISKGSVAAFRQRMTVNHFLGQIRSYNAKYLKAKKS
ncbi:MAG: glucosyl-dolichyl phosphate glucuronosyltransferase [Methyloprofundus sp.]|nr:MAG: glucosyl-dolichyl phosphate glucuronosyltransferase [Methyloprofundus sp.]